MSVIDPLGFLGRDFVGYVAACDPQSVDAALADCEHADHERARAAIEACRQITDGANPDQIHYLLASFDPDAGTSVGNRIRQEVSGQDPPAPGVAEGVLESLELLARDIYPALLLPSRPSPTQSSGWPTSPLQLITASLLSNPAAQGVEVALRDDPLMDLLAPNGGTGFVAFANGGGMGVGCDLLPTSLIGAAAARTRLFHSELTLELLIRELGYAVADLYAIVGGEPIDLPVAVALHGLDVQPGEHLDLPWGTILSSDGGVQSALGNALPPSHAIFATKINSPVATGAATGASPPQLPQARMRAFHTELDSRIRKTTLSLLLMERDSPLCAVPTRSVAITPFFGSGWASVEITPDPRAATQGALRADDRPALQAAVSLVDAHYAPSLAIPTRRLTSALMVRNDIEDGLVDAVVALESLFAGTDSGELTFRIGAAIAWLVGRTAEERLQLQREIGRLYSLRSKILHRGNAGQEDVTSERDRTVQLGIEALRALLTDHPDLVDEENRGKTIIMRGEGPT